MERSHPEMEPLAVCSSEVGAVRSRYRADATSVREERNPGVTRCTPVLYPLAGPDNPRGGETIRSGGRVSLGEARVTSGRTAPDPQPLGQDLSGDEGGRGA